MVVALTANRPAAAGNEEILAEIGSGAVAAQSELLRLAELDAAAYDAVIRARRLPKDTERERQSRDAQVHQATREATLAPLETVRRAADVLGLAERLAPIGNRNAVSDVGVGALLAVTAVRGAALNVRINLPYLADDDPLRDDADAQLQALLDRIDERERDVRNAVEARLA
jgi:glutamate formiminotransferase/formiminotetrahydrofolate cyclodeaminase